MTDNRTTELLPCPFREHKRKKLVIHHRKHRWYEGGLYAVKCETCGIRGPYALSEEKAVEKWNQRHVETCEIESSFLNDFSSNHECWFEFDLSCGHHIKSDVMEPPNYCEVCGAKVVG